MPYDTKPPKAWFDKMYEKVSKYADDPSAVVGWIWYHWLSPEKRQEIIQRGFDPDLDPKLEALGDLDKYFDKVDEKTAGSCEVFGCKNKGIYKVKSEYEKFLPFKHYCKYHAEQVAKRLRVRGFDPDFSTYAKKHLPPISDFLEAYEQAWLRDFVKNYKDFKVKEAIVRLLLLKDNKVFPEFAIYIPEGLFEAMLKTWIKDFGCKFDISKGKIAIRTNKFNLFIYEVS